MSAHAGLGGGQRWRTWPQRSPAQLLSCLPSQRTYGGLATPVHSLLAAPLRRLHLAGPRAAQPLALRARGRHGAAGGGSHRVLRWRSAARGPAAVCRAAAAGRVRVRAVGPRLSGWLAAAGSGCAPPAHADASLAPAALPSLPLPAGARSARRASARSLATMLSWRRAGWARTACRACGAAAPRPPAWPPPPPPPRCPPRWTSCQAWETFRASPRCRRCRWAAPPAAAFCPWASWACRRRCQAPPSQPPSLEARRARRLQPPRWPPPTRRLPAWRPAARRQPAAPQRPPRQPPLPWREPCL